MDDEPARRFCVQLLQEGGGACATIVSGISPGAAVNREKSNNLVAASVEAIRAAQGSLQLVVPPEGTRSKVRYWKTGFYYIAHGAGVPIVLSYMDYARKVSGIGPVFHPTGDIERDMERIKAFYAPFKGKNPDQSGH